MFSLKTHFFDFRFFLLSHFFSRSFQTESTRFFLFEYELEKDIFIYNLSTFS